MKKLINWSTVPIGTNVKTSTDRYTHDGSLKFCSIDVMTGLSLTDREKIYDAYFDEVYLDFSKPQPWNYYEHGVTIVPEWADVVYKGVSMFGISCPWSSSVVQNTATEYTFAYRIVGIKDGYTDNINEVAT